MESGLESDSVAICGGILTCFPQFSLRDIAHFVPRNGLDFQKYATIWSQNGYAMQEERYANIPIVRGRETPNCMHIERYALRQNAIREVLLYMGMVHYAHSIYHANSKAVV